MMAYQIRQIHPEEYGPVRALDRDAFAFNERHSDGAFHEIFADNIRRSPYFIPELDLVAVTGEGIFLGHAIFSTLPMGDGPAQLVWLNSLAVKHGEQDDHSTKTYAFQRKGIGTALVREGLRIAQGLGYTGCMTCGHPAVYRQAMGFSAAEDFGIAWDDSVEDPASALHAIELVPGGFESTNKFLSYKHYDFAQPDASQLDPAALILALSTKLGLPILRASYQAEALHGGTLGQVWLVTGEAITQEHGKLPYEIVLKKQMKWIRYGDPGSWRREYDLYASPLGSVFAGNLRWPACYHREMNESQDEIQLWVEYIDALSGRDLTVEMYAQAALELGRFQGRLYADPPEFLREITNLSGEEYVKNYYLRYRSWDRVHGYIRSEACEIPGHLCDMLIQLDAEAEAIFRRMDQLPRVLCHRDFWVANIFYAEGKITLIDWDTAGWGRLGEDLASLIADEADVEHMVELYRACVPAYIQGFGERADIGHMKDFCVWEFILMLFGYRLVEWFLDSETQEDKALQLDTLQKIYEMRHASHG